MEVLGIKFLETLKAGSLGKYNVIQWNLWSYKEYWNFMQKHQ